MDYIGKVAWYGSANIYQQKFNWNSYYQVLFFVWLSFKTLTYGMLIMIYTCLSFEHFWCCQSWSLIIVYTYLSSLNAYGVSYWYKFLSCKWDRLDDLDLDKHTKGLLFNDYEASKRKFKVGDFTLFDELDWLNSSQVFDDDKSFLKFPNPV